MDAASTKPLSSSNERHEPPLEKMPGHWLLAKLGKRVLRPGGLELTRKLLDALAISSDDVVVEFAPGLGATARMTLARQPHSYTAVERDAAAAKQVETLLPNARCRCILGTAEETGMPDSTACVVYGEAMLSMQPAAAKAKIIFEAARLLRPGGRYGIHELCIVPDEAGEQVRQEIAADLGGDIHVGISPLTEREWRDLLSAAGLQVTAEFIAPMHLLEPSRVVRDEGLLRAMRFAWNVMCHRVARKRVLAMRRSFRKHRKNLAAIVLVAEKS